MLSQVALKKNIDVNYYKFVVSMVKMQEVGDRRYNTKRLVAAAMIYTSLTNQVEDVRGVTNEIIVQGIKTFNKLTNSTISTSSCIIANHASAGTSAAYQINADTLAAGSCKINIRNISGGALSEAIVLNFIVLGMTIA